MTGASTEIPETWVQATIGDVCTQPQYGYTTKASGSGDLLLLRTSDITSSRIAWETVPYCSTNPVDIEPYLLEAGDIVVSRAGSVGVSRLITNPKKAVFASYLIRLKPLIDERYLSYFLESPGYWTAINSETLGIAVPNVNATKLKSIQVPVPPIQEQRRIVFKIDELFSELDKGIESLKTARRQLEVYRQAVLKHAFEGKLTARWREENKDKLETQEQLLARVKKERVTHYERQLVEWKINVGRGEKNIRRSLASRPAKLKDVAGLSPEETEGLPLLPGGWSYSRLGLLIDEPKYGTSKKCDYNFEGTGVLRIPNVVRGLIDDADLKGACFEDDEKWAFSLRSGDILMIRSNGSIAIVGKCALMSSAEQQYLYAGYLIRIRSNPVVVLPEYLAPLISSHLVRVQIEGFAKSTSGVNNINSGEIQSLIVPLCGVPEQQEVVAQLSSVICGMDATAAEIDEQLRTTDTLRQAILKKAFAGQLVTQDPSEEPASVLLEKIRMERAKAGKSGPTARKNRKAKTGA